MNKCDLHTSSSWLILNKRMSAERLQTLKRYAEQYFVPILERFPELKGRVFLTIRKQGWFARTKPRPHIIIWEETLRKGSPWRIRALTTHELAHLLQDLQQDQNPPQYWSKQAEKYTTFLAFSRGSAYDFLKTLQTECDHYPCDHKYYFNYFYCFLFFAKCCRSYGEEEIRNLALRLEELAIRYKDEKVKDLHKLICEALRDSCGQ